MKAGILLMLTILAASTAAARAHEQWRVRMFYNPNGQSFKTGDTVPAGQVITLLFLDEPCGLDVSTASTMHRAWQQLGAYQVGCWHQSTRDDDSFLIFDGAANGRVEEYSGIFPHGQLQPDGSVTITEPNYSSETFEAAYFRKKSEEQIKRLSEHMNEGPVPQRAQRAVSSRQQASSDDAPSAWTIQLGIFGSRENAERLLEQVKGEGYAAVIDETSVRSKQVYHVRVGQESNQAAAAALGEKLRAAGYNGRVVPLP